MGAVGGAGKKPPPSTVTTVIVVLIFLSTGFWMSVGVQELVYAGADDLGLVMLGYVILLPLIACMDKAPTYQHLTYLIGLGVLETVASFLFALALMLAGSSYHTVIYASLTAITAALRRLILKKSITYLQWVAIGLVLVGLCMVVKDAEIAADNVPKRDIADDNLGLGIALSFLCVLVMSLLYICMEYIQSVDEPSSPVTLTWVVGTVEVILSVIYCLVTVVPNWNERVTVPMASPQKQHSITYVLLMYLSIAISYSSHLFAFIWIIGSAPDGGVFVGMLQGVRVLFVVVYGGVFLCQGQVSQCISTDKVIACFFVVGGVYIFVKSHAIAKWYRGREACPSNSSPGQGEGEGEALLQATEHEEEDFF